MASPFCLLTSILLALLASILQIHGHESVGLTFDLPNKEKMCFYESFKRIKQYVFTYQVLKGGRQDIDVTVQSPNKKVIYRAKKAVKDTFRFETSTGLYAICFSNEFSKLIHKVIYFELRPEGQRPLAVEAGIKRPTANTKIEEALETLHQKNTDVIRYQREYRLKEIKGRFLAETINKGVFWWSLGQSVVIFVVMTSQVLVLKCFFTERRKSSVPPKDEEVVYAKPLDST